MEIPRRYYFTTFGEVYAGLVISLFKFENYQLVIQGDKLTEFNKVRDNDHTLAEIKKYGYPIPSKAIVGHIDILDAKLPERPHANWQTFNGNVDRSTMFIFGAGASANCVTGHLKDAFANDPLRPPLGNELFASRFRPYYGKYEGVKLSLFDLQQSSVNVEEYLEDEWAEIEESANKIVLSKHINIQFYLQEILKDISQKVIDEYYETNLFAKLADKLQKISSRAINKQFSFVSFNQDTILEHFLCRHFKHKLNSLDDYIEPNNSPFVLFKPHGSWNWGWPFRERKSNWPQYLYDSEANFHNVYFEHLGNIDQMLDWYSFGFESMHNPNGIGKLTINKALLQLCDSHTFSDYYPALLLPYRDKDEFTLPHQHFYSLRQYLEYAETLIIIGWKGNERIFNNWLLKDKRRLKKIVIVDPHPEEVKQFLAPLVTDTAMHVTYYSNFEEFVTSGLDKELSN